MIYTLQGLRALATLGIFLFHSGLLLHGRFPVTFFFMLSGFVTYYKMNEKVESMNFKDGLNWITRKLKKLYPIHFITYIASIVVRWNWVSGLSIVEFIQKSFLNLALIQSFFKNDVFNFNSLSWFLSVIFILYIFSIPLTKIINKIGYKYIILMIGSILITQYCLNTYNIISGDKLYLYSNPIYRILDFSLGMLSASLYINVDIKISKPKITESLIVGIFFVMYAISLFVETRCSYYNLIFVISLYVFAKGKGNVSMILNKDLLQKFAKISFEFYMTHELVLKVFRKVFVNINAHWLIVNILICIPALFISIIIATLLHKLVTKKYRVIVEKTY